MRLHRAEKQDLPAIQELLATYGSGMTISPEHLTKRDIALCARDASGALVGFVFFGLMAAGTIAYTDKFCVAKTHAKQGVGKALLQEAFRLGRKRGVKQVIGFIKRDEYHDRSAINALRMAVGGSLVPYTMVEAQLSHMQSELGAL